MKIYILTENCAGGHFLAEHGLSYLIQIDEQMILFDTGSSVVFLKNAAQMGINLEKEVKSVILSHGHWDHGDGLRYLQNKQLITHPEAFIKRFRKKDLSPVGLSLTKNDIKNRYQITETKIPLQITNHLVYLGEIPRINDFEAQTTSFTDGHGHDDFIPDDSALAAVANNKLIVITGCSHAGICNIVDYAKKVTGISEVHAVLGGFHLKAQNVQTKKTIEYMKENQIKQIFPSHCTELPALALFYETFQCSHLKTGMTLEF